MRRDAQGHRRGDQAGSEVFVKGLGHEFAQRVAELPGIGDGMLLLPPMITKVSCGLGRIRRYGPPVIALAQVTVREGRWVGRGSQGRIDVGSIECGQVHGSAVFGA